MASDKKMQLQSNLLEPTLTFFCSVLHGKDANAKYEKGTKDRQDVRPKKQRYEQKSTGKHEVALPFLNKTNKNWLLNQRDYYTLSESRYMIIKNTKKTTKS